MTNLSSTTLTATSLNLFKRQSYYMIRNMKYIKVKLSGEKSLVHLALPENSKKINK